MSRSQEYVRDSIKKPSETQMIREERKRIREEELQRKNTCEADVVTTSTRRKAKNTRRRILYLLIIAVILAAISIQGVKIYSLAKEKEALKEVQYNLIKEKARLEEELTNVNSAEYVEQQAREQLKLIMPGEILYIFPKIQEDTRGEED